MTMPFWVWPQSVVWTLVHLYVWARLVKGTTSPGTSARRLGNLAAVVLAPFIPAAVIGGFALEADIARWVLWPGYIWYAFELYLALLLIAAEPVRLAVRVAGRLRRRRAESPQGIAAPETATLHAASPGAARPDHHARPTDARPTDARPDHARPDHARPGDTRPGDAGPGDAGPGDVRPSDTRPGAAGPDEAAVSGAPSGGAPAPTRRVFLARSIAAVAGTATAGIVGYGMATALGPLRLDRVTMRLNRGGARLAGTRIALVGDVHLGPMLGRDHTRRIVDMVNSTAPDVVAIVGDLVDGTVEDLAYAAAPLRDLRSRHGTYFVTGNHEYLSGVDAWVDHLRELGVRSLRNERLELPAFDIAGVNDITGDEWRDGPDYDRALGDRDPSRPVVLLAHQPVQVREAVRHNVDLQLSGHTHGGQTFPLDLLTARAQPLLDGHATFGETQLYVTKGAGFWGPPIRVGAPPDITLIELTT